MNEERHQILRMLADGQITVDDAEKLIAALERDQPAPSSTDVVPSKTQPKYVRVFMDAASEGDGPSRINIRVPLKLLRAGVRLTSLIPPIAVTRINTELNNRGIPLDLGELKPQQLEDLIEGLYDLTIDMDDPGNKMRVYCE
ncbi:MAG TPA: hypothetical protein VE172_02050 [Stackebrandtia sp.]|jgi:hypothetical protein|uniref:SHOCT-like domain-containing protein n=1 Tax=Stackebrandtia sp. TaxID=2023065 RepID=UPI002D66E6A6|nr:hypothetical protein [Stackebrandtia sp.]HZE37568.1 hypothetical protein [Stackebrandtia sp.]